MTPQEDFCDENGSISVAHSDDLEHVVIMVCSPTGTTTIGLTRDDALAVSASIARVAGALLTTRSAKQ